jgi:colicin import membrane protein
VNAFVREHAAALFGSVLLHGLLLAAALAVAWYAVAPKVTMPAAIEAYVAPAPSPRAAPAASPAPAPPSADAQVAAPPVPQPAPAPEPPRPTPDETRAAQEREHQEAQLQAAQLQAARARARAVQAAEARRRAEAEAARQREAAAAQKRAAEAAATAAAAEKRRAEADARQRAARESDLERALAAEERHTGAVNAGLQARYVAEIQARIERAWIRPPTARPGLRCVVYVTQVPGGTVTNVRLGECNGDAAVQQSITLAVYKASPLPTPPDPSLFERNLQLVFAPDA